MISQLVHDDGPDGRMSTSAIVNNTILLFVAGHDSTVNLISHCVLTMLRNPWSIELLRSRPELIPGAIEEVLRLQSSVQFFPTPIRAGRHRHRRHHDPARRAHLSHVRRGQPGSAALPRSQHVRSPARRQRACGLGAQHPHLFRRSAGPPGSQHRVSRRSFAAWTTRGWSRIRRPTASARCSAARGICSSTTTRSGPELTPAWWR